MIDAKERVTGQINYVLNLELPGMLHGKILRSPHAHARVLSVDTSKAETLPGVVAVLSRNDLLNQDTIFPYFGPVIRDQGVVAMDKVRFVGDPVAAVAAVDVDTAAAALELIEVEYEELPAVVDEADAIKPDAPVLHESFAKVTTGFADVILNTQEGTNFCNHFKLRKGDVDKGFAEADYVFEDVFRSPAVQHVTLEPHVSIGQVEAGKITVWTGTQTPHVVRSQVAEIFKVPMSQVRIIVHTLGGGYGGKCYPKLEPIAAVMAWKAGRPVKFVLTREEDFLTLTKHGVTVYMKTGVRKDGTITARENTCYFNTGAYADIGPRLIKNGGYGTAGPYRCDNVKIDSYAVYTNTVPAGAFRGYGISQGAWAYESQMDMIAERLGMDPYELRMKNLLRDGDTFCTGEEVHDMHYPELLADAARAVDWSGWRRDGRDGATERQGDGGTKKRGRAVTTVIKGTVTPSTSTAAAKLNEDGSLNVLTSSVEMGQGAKTVLAQMAAHYCDVPLEQVLVSEPDTDSTPYDQQTSSSRTTFSMGRAVKGAVVEIKEELLKLAAEQLEVAVGDLETGEGRVLVKGAPNRSLSYGEVVRKARRGNILGRGSFVTEGGLDPETGQGIGSVHWHHAATSCEVEVDTETGRIDVTKFHANVYAGVVVNPQQCELQTEGSTFFGLGQALYEAMVYEDGRLVNGNLGDYMIMSFEDVPKDLSVFVLERPGSDEVHGIGETSLPPVMPCVANAVYDAVGVRIKELPLTPEKVLRALQEKEAGKSEPVAAAR
jgi:CO/xanthine dehydrogenase Mo-binding subunit